MWHRVLPLLALSIAVFAAVTTPSHASQSGTAGFVFLPETAGTGTYSFQNGPEEPPDGSVSARLSTPSPIDTVELGVAGANGTKLADVTAISFSTYTQNRSHNADPSIRLAIDPDGDGPATWTRLIYEPARGPVAPIANSWQHWDAYDNGHALWWCLTELPGLPISRTVASWSDITGHNPDAIVFPEGPSLSIGQGRAAGGMVAFVNGLYFDGKHYGFAPSQSGMRDGSTAPRTPPWLAGLVGGTVIVVAATVFVPSRLCRRRFARQVLLWAECTRKLLSNPPKSALLPVAEPI